jgi:type III secretion system FlhB-like substrate exporter
MREKMSQIDSKSKATSGQYGLAQVPQENGIKRCGYCDMLVRWTTSHEDGGKNVALNSDGSLHQCLLNGTAKRRDPVKHGRPTAQEVISFLNSTNKYREGSAAGPASGAGGSASAIIAAQQSLPNQQQQEQLQQQRAAPVGNDAPAAATQQQKQHQQQQSDRDAVIKAMHEANIAAWKAQAEAAGRLADAMVEVARSADALVKVASDLATSNYRLSNEVAKLTGLIQGIVDWATARKERGGIS